ncbi:SycD/LcrH family type III secretion system chaperone [Pseudomonas entomophila]|uniref:SycD/LcrH family type III secretion system chaperone n=1 Tax=Pseudomonas entomophila TaxID=312306 RepID=UPI00240719B7|nr:SycD/LcrH family type III secretion system chaperone [Pseudomonas entomophila]MDF9618790.1 SycD/LcrH family type III secretion system chaperone [Pseudomonas entomophila]
MTPSTATPQNDIDSAIEAFMNQGGTLAMLKGISDVELDQFYALAHGYYQSGKLQEAETFFRGLSVLNQYDPRFWLGLGACRQGLKQYDLAIQCYAYGAMVDVKEPRFPFHAAECHVELGDWVAAESGFYSARALAEACPEQAEIGARADLMLEHIASQKEE